MSRNSGTDITSAAARDRALGMAREYLDGKSLREVGDAHGITIGRVQQIFKTALERGWIDFRPKDLNRKRKRKPLAQTDD